MSDGKCQASGLCQGLGKLGRNGQAALSRDPGASWAGSLDHSPFPMPGSEAVTPLWGETQGHMVPQVPHYGPRDVLSKGDPLLLP